MESDLEKEVFKKVTPAKKTHPQKTIQIKKSIEKLFKEVNENVCKQIRDWTEPHPVWTLLRGEYFDETKCWD